jgi:hypothetical protein
MNPCQKNTLTNSGSWIDCEVLVTLNCPDKHKVSQDVAKLVIEEIREKGVARCPECKKAVSTKPEGLLQSCINRVKDKMFP